MKSLDYEHERDVLEFTPTRESDLSMGNTAHRSVALPFYLSYSLHPDL